MYPHKPVMKLFLSVAMPDDGHISRAQEFFLKLVALTCALTLSASGQAPREPLPAPGFHHLHLNSTNPDAAIAFYLRQFPNATKTIVAGLPALKAGQIYILFTKVTTPPPTEPQTAIWHFGWHVVDVHRSLEMYRQRKDLNLLPLYTGDDDRFVYVSSDTWPGAAGSLGRTRAEIAEAKAKGIQPTHGAGFAYLEGPDGAIIEYSGNYPTERFNHVHLYQKDPYCAELWYQRHLAAQVSRATGTPSPTEEPARWRVRSAHGPRSSAKACFACRRASPLMISRCNGTFSPIIRPW